MKEDKSGKFSKEPHPSRELRRDLRKSIKDMGGADVEDEVLKPSLDPPFVSFHTLKGFSSTT